MNFLLPTTAKKRSKDTKQADNGFARLKRARDPKEFLFAKLRGLAATNSTKIAAVGPLLVAGARHVFLYSLSLCETFH